MELISYVEKNNKKICDRVINGIDLINYNFNDFIFENVSFTDSNLMGSSFVKATFINCSFHNCNLKKTNFSNANLRENKLSSCDLREANFYYAVLEKAKLIDLKIDQSTKFFGNRCPKYGAFIGYKKCFNYKIAKLLILSDSKRSSATTEGCRCDKVRVLSISNFEGSKYYQSASSLNDPSIIYKVGEVVYPDHYDEDGWNDSSYGIHFFMSRQEAIDY